ncbi:DUF3375 domain-containing protein [Magnetospirillum sp. UT-4]|uniref:DUF3375 domain-containing protein n=1 Tax=Magnetospirillum sp. UT-4 TaxID=2681467 RepID=UPI00137C4674|nr:DUF3375 domain-containing protein [Magnetospirillum sp. UT-4]CAA7612922.1 conserved hypothetical protein [Magnetospirillum sp. UT-4]
MDFGTLTTLRKTHPGWRLLAAGNVVMVASFLHRAFIAPNQRSMSQPDLAARLDDFLFDVGREGFPRPAAEYLDEWASDRNGWLRKYYPPDSDQAHFDLTPATEKAIEWLSSLQQRPFIGTESRLMTVFELLRQLIEGSQLDPAQRIAELEKRKARIEADIARIRRDGVTPMDDVQIKDRFLQMAGTARGLLSDFREVEQNFRDLDRTVREKVATWDGAKSVLLEEVFGRHDVIADSDQGRSFRAFWDFLMSSDRQEELGRLLDAVLKLEPVKALEPDRRIRRVHHDWLEAGEGAQATVRRLSEQLRRYLDDRAWAENRRILDLIRNIRQGALAVRDSPPAGDFIALEKPAPEIDLPFERPLFTPPLKARITSGELQEGKEEVATESLYDQTMVDRDRLAAAIRRALQSRPQVSLGEVAMTQPLEQGLAELMTYLGLAAEDAAALIDDRLKDSVFWDGEDGVTRRATLPMVVYCREAAS